MPKTPLKDVIYWGIGGAAAGAFTMLFYASASGVSGSRLLAGIFSPLLFYGASQRVCSLTIPGVQALALLPVS